MPVTMSQTLLPKFRTLKVDFSIELTNSSATWNSEPQQDSGCGPVSEHENDAVICLSHGAGTRGALVPVRWRPYSV
jgi:hypothetical protein